MTLTPVSFWMRQMQSWVVMDELREPKTTKELD
jgi:hypothetical protein